MQAILALLIVSTGFASNPNQGAFLKSSNAVFDPGPKTSEGELNFVAEIAGGTANKYELRTASGQLFLDRVICPREIPGTKRTIQNYPLSYGITPGRFNVDGDPLDLIVAGSGEFYRKQASSGSPKARKVRVVGLLTMEECEEPPCKEEQWQQDYKVLAVDPADKKYARVKVHTELPPEELKTYTEYFSNYKGQKNGGPLTRVKEMGSREDALKMIREKFPVADPKTRAEEIAACRKLYSEIFDKQRLSAPDAPVEKNEKFLTCVQRVHDERFVHGNMAFDFFREFSGAQRTLELGETGVTRKNAAEKLSARKAAKKTYYRYAAHDLAAPPGTGNPIFEWIKTKGRNEGCPADFPPQHYEARALVDLK